MSCQTELGGGRSGRMEALSNRRNIVVIADEAHRSQYDFIDGFARYMRDALPHASFIGFTGTPVELTDKDTRAVFGDYISVYDIQRAVNDKATVPIYYESRLAKLELDEAERPNIDTEFEEVTEGEEVERKERLKTKWAQLEAIVGSEKRLKLIARDIVGHFEKRLDAMDGKAMVVCMSRRICVELYREIAPGGCLSGTLRWSSFANFFPERFGPAAAKTSFSPAPFPRCWSRPSGGIKTGRSRQCRSSKS